jgi:hypothetical protein
MARVPSVESIFWFAAIACYAILLARMAISRLHVVYRYFFFYLLFRLGRSLLLAGLDRRSSAYGWAYLGTEPIVWVLYILVVLELFTIVLRDYPGIQTLSRRVLAAGLAISATVALATLLPDLGNPAERYPILRIMYVAQRVVMSSLVVFFAILTAFLVWYPVPLSRNVVVYCAGYSLYFISSTMGLFVRNIAGESVTRITSTVLQGFAVACLIAWIALLNRQGETKRLSLRSHMPAPDEARLVGQLESINRGLLRSAKK